VKTRIIGSLLILLIVGGLYLVTLDEGTSRIGDVQSAPSTNDSALKTLSFN
jgi:hypothetical protein